MILLTHLSREEPFFKLCSAKLKIDLPVEFLDTSCSSSMTSTNLCHTQLATLCLGFYKDQLVSKSNSSKCNFIIKEDKMGRVDRTHGKS